MNGFNECMSELMKLYEWIERIKQIEWNEMIGDEFNELRWTSLMMSSELNEWFESEWMNWDNRVKRPTKNDKK